MVFEQTGSASGEYITYYCNDILIVCIDSVGKFMWSNRIEKKQAEKYFLKFARYRILYKENKMYIIYNAGYERKSFFYVNCFEDEMIYIAEVAQEGTVKIRPIEAPDRAICDLASVIYDPKSDFMHFIVTYPLNGINYKDIRVAKFKLKDLEIN